jgi:hypothetical protein
VFARATLSHRVASNAARMRSAIGPTNEGSVANLVTTTDANRRATRFVPTAKTKTRRRPRSPSRSFGFPGSGPSSSNQ